MGEGNDWQFTSRSRRVHIPGPEQAVAQRFEPGGEKKFARPGKAAPISSLMHEVRFWIMRVWLANGPVQEGTSRCVPGQIFNDSSNSMKFASLQDPPTDAQGMITRS